jgi:cell fate (sporulation/competence/biofilm development) regulator YlbF (YheA/YmcA/DUF963 family)
MQTAIEETTITQKTRELCQAILDQPNMAALRQSIDAFMADDTSKAQYEDLMNKGQALQQKQESSMPLTGEEIAAFEEQREALLKNPVASAFLDAREEMQQVQQSILQYVGKTIELGRVPTEEDLSEGEGGGCGSGCGCHH